MPATDRLFRFGSAVKFTLDEGSRTLLADGKPVELGGRAFDTLVTLLRNRGQMVSRSVLMDAVWPGVAVEDNNLSVQISYLRKALGERHIRTVPGRGYCFVSDPDAAVPVEPPTDEPTAPVLATNLPSTLKPLIGRLEERAELAQLLCQHPQVSVVGPAGVGKTLVVQHVLRELEPQFRHGVCFVDLAQVPAGGDIGGAVAESLGIQANPAAGQMPLAKLLQPLELLLALDNAEHVLDSVGQFVQGIAQSAPRVKVVVTTQARLKLPLEKVLVLGSLKVPPQGTPLAKALSYGAIALFASCAAAVDSRFELTESDVEPAIQLCAGLDGMPLAIELAAWRATHLGVAKLYQSLGSRLSILQGRRREVPQRQQSMRAALQWSYELLGEPEREVFRRMAVVCASLELDALLDILTSESSEPGASRWMTLDVLTTLVDRSLVDVVPGRDGRTRYRLLETPKAFARELLEASPDAEAVARRHSQVLAARLGAAYLNAAYGDVSRSAWSEQHRDEYHDAVAAMDWALRHSRPDLVAQLAPALLLLTPDGDVVSSRRHYDLCLDVAVTSDDALATFLALDCCTWQWPSGAEPPFQLVADLLQAADVTAHLPDIDKRRYIAQCKYVASWAMQQDVVVSRLQWMLEAAREIEDPAWPPALRRARCIAEMKLARRLGDADAAYLQSLVYRDINARAGVAPYFSDVAIFEAAMMAGRLSDAIEAARRALQVVSGSRDLQLEILVRSHLATAYLIGEKLHEAEPHVRVILENTPPDSITFAYVLDYIALAAALGQRWALAARLFGSASKTMENRGLVRWGHDKQAARLTEAKVVAQLGDERWKALQEEGARLAPTDLLTAYLASLEPGLEAGTS